MVEIMAVADEVADAKVDEVADAEVNKETDARSTSAHTVKRAITPPKHAERENALKTTKGIQSPPGKTNKLATTVVSQDTSNPTESTSNVPGINATK